MQGEKGQVPMHIGGLELQLLAKKNTKVKASQRKMFITVYLCALAVYTYVWTPLEEFGVIRNSLSS